MRQVWARGVCWGAVVGLVGLAGCVEAPPEEGRPWREVIQEVVVCADGPTVAGIDVSKWQGEINWDRVAGDGIKYAFIRATNGLNIDDEYFDRNWAEARRVGVLRGAYQYFRPGQDAVAQAELFVRRMGPLQPGDLPPVIDVEATDDQPPQVVATKVRQWLERVEELTGVRPIIYTGKYFWQDNVNSADFTQYPLWIPQYGPECPNLPEPWREWLFFQTSSTGRVAGISGNVDTDLFNGDMAALRAVTVGEAVCGDGVCHGQEDHASCPGDCPGCDPVPAGGRIIDDADACFFGGGDPRWLRRVEAGWDGGLIWTHATDSQQVANYGLWELSFERAGDYTVEVYIDPAWAETRQAAYEIAHAGTTEEVVLDQTTAQGWTELGVFGFAQGGQQHLRLDDNTGEALSEQLQIVLDAVRLTPVDGPPDDMPDAGVPDADVETPDAETPDDTPDVGAPDAGDDDPGRADVDVPDDEEQDAGGLPQEGAEVAPRVKGTCATAPGAPILPGGVWWALALGLLALARRRTSSDAARR